MTIYKICKLFADGVASGEGAPYKRWKSCRVYVGKHRIKRWGQES